MILLSKCRPNKDFGRGFYLTDIRNQAEAMANRRCEFEGEGIANWSMRELGFIWKAQSIFIATFNPN